MSERCMVGKSRVAWFVLCLACSRASEGADELPLNRAAEAGQIETVKELLKDKSAIDVADKYGYTALHYAVRSRKLAVVKLLLEKGANPNAPDDEGRSPMFYVRGPESEKLVRLLVLKGADPSFQDENDDTPLHRAGKDMALIKALSAAHRRGARLFGSGDVPSGLQGHRRLGEESWRGHAIGRGQRGRARGAGEGSGEGPEQVRAEVGPERRFEHTVLGDSGGAV